MGRKYESKLYEATNAEKERERERRTMETTRVLVVALAHGRARWW